MVKDNKIVPRSHPKIIKKRTKAFVRHHADRYYRLKATWRRPRGIDNAMRRRFRGTAPMTKISYASNKKTRNLHPDGLLRYRVFNVSDLEVLLMNNRKYAAVIAHNVSAKNRRAIEERANQLNIKIANTGARLAKEENE
nr:60S ribosomal protein L32 [Seculamonas ecuadoriensis]